MLWDVWCWQLANFKQQTSYYKHLLSTAWRWFQNLILTESVHFKFFLYHMTHVTWEPKFDIFENKYFGKTKDRTISFQGHMTSSSKMTYIIWFMWRRFMFKSHFRSTEGLSISNEFMLAQSNTRYTMIFSPPFFGYKSI